MEELIVPLKVILWGVIGYFSIGIIVALAAIVTFGLAFGYATFKSYRNRKLAAKARKERLDRNRFV